MVHHGGGVASLIGDSGISLDGQSILLPDEDGGIVGYNDDDDDENNNNVNMMDDDDISSINDSCYRTNFCGDGNQRIQIVGKPIEDTIEDGNIHIPHLSPAAIALNEQLHRNSHTSDSHASPYLPAVKYSSPPPKKNHHHNHNNKGEHLPHNTHHNMSMKKRQRNQKGCVPLWIADAPQWLKFVIAFSSALLIGAVVLVTVALATALTKRGEDSSSAVDLSNMVGNTNINNNNNVGSVGWGSSDAPGPTTNTQETVQGGSLPITAPPTVGSFLNRPTFESQPAPTPVLTPQEEEEEESIKTPAVSPTDYPQATDQATEQTIETTTTPPEVVAEMEIQPQVETTEASESSYDPDVVTFFVTGGRFTNNALAQVPAQLGTMPVRGGTSFLVHLGDWNSPYATRCDEQSYQDVNDLFSNSSIPVYFLPGDNDYNGMLFLECS